MNRRIVILVALATLLAGCAGTSRMMLGEARPPIDPSQVRIYRTPPPGAVDIAELEASSAIGFGTQGQADAVMARLRREAAALGANGLLILGRGRSGSGGGVSVGAGSYGRHSGGSIGLGIPTSQQRAAAIAIYVPPPPRD